MVSIPDPMLVARALDPVFISLERTVRKIGGVLRNAISAPCQWGEAELHTELLREVLSGIFV